MSYILENLNEFERLEKQSQYTNYDYRKELADFKIRPGAKILDAGCGSGIVSRHLAATHRDASITAVDFSEDRIKAARDMAKNLNNINFVQGDLTKLNFSDNTFDHVICRFVLQHLKIDNKNQFALAELYRVLKPGGTLLVIESDGLMKNLYPQSDFLRECLDKLDKEGPVDFDLGRKIPTMMAAAGFQAIDWSANVCQCKGISLEEELILTKERLETAMPFLQLFFKNKLMAQKFQAEYLQSLKMPSSTYYFCKTTISGNKPKRFLKLSTLDESI